MKLTNEQMTLIANALFDKANGDREAAQEGTAGMFPAEVDVLNTTAAQLAAILREQAQQADDLAEVFMNGDTCEVLP